MSLRVSQVEYLQTVKERAIDHITISVTTDMVDEKTVVELNELIAEHPGKTKIFIQLHDSSGKHHVLLRSRNHEIDVKHSLLHFIEEQAGLSYKIN